MRVKERHGEKYIGAKRQDTIKKNYRIITFPQFISKI